jgi:hypothetical protein
VLYAPVSVLLPTPVMVFLGIALTTGISEAVTGFEGIPMRGGSFDTAIRYCLVKNAPNGVQPRPSRFNGNHN